MRTFSLPSGIVVFVALVLAASSVAAQLRGAPPPQLTIASAVVDYDAATIAIHGDHFAGLQGDATPSVFMTDLAGSLQPLPVLFATSTFVSAGLLHQGPGTFTLVVARGPVATDVSAIDLTLGVPGPQGPQGQQGEKGETGDAGPEGPEGSQGPPGPQGETGPLGEIGPQGPLGETGEAGETGPSGAQGPQGLQGPERPAGPLGPRGAQGPSGPPGVQGPQGPARAIGFLRFSVDFTCSNTSVVESECVRTLNCPEGKVALTGGALAPSNMRLTRSYRGDQFPPQQNDITDPKRWTVHVLQPGLTTLNVSAYAVCVDE
jgi:hypothetical protein